MAISRPGQKDARFMVNTQLQGDDPSALLRCLCFGMQEGPGRGEAVLAAKICLSEGSIPCATKKCISLPSMPHRNATRLNQDTILGKRKEY